ncbi:MULTISPECIES: aspartate aminotransferase family protein [Roseobacteraceae]|uniref:aspartate aminotransferase family protein n=1 Tax=Roseobacteraceae TaxID=2854170 RepID=UPI00080AC1B7|nr:MULTISPECIES: aspartate aminotransferase family protein [Roseobacteraceae]ANT61173.1 aminotransferase [Salipiger sp. CCB-MM3]MCA0994408.1 aspartate aminotransferase family protein [Alloyangia pacifica]NDW01009.1 aspartate aminotransferase family protein [Salipiger sp. PrR002]NDW59603.1 aspartate aminotransferase family protein [Salipiger sp. PrR004]
MNKIPNSLHASDIAHSMHPYTNMRLHEEQGPMIITRGEGVHVYDSEGKEYIEGLAGLWSVAVGFSQPRLTEAAAKQMAELPYYHTFAHKAHEPSIRLAEKLAEMTPEGMDRVFFTNSGSEANDTVIKMVWFYNNALGRPEKKKFLARNKAYHGITIASGSLTGLPANHKDFDLPAIPVTHLTCPHYWKWAEEGETEADFTARLLKEAEDTILAEGPETIAGFIGEPVMGAGGVMTPPEGYWPGIRALCDKYDILLVSDEVINGFGRCGTPFGCEKYGFTPDIMVTSKQLTSSYMPLAAIIVNDKVYNTIADHTAKLGTFGHGFTGSGHPVACAVGLENLKIIEEQDLMGNAARLEAKFQEGLRKFADHPLVGEVRGVGLIGGIELAKDKAKRQSFEPGGKVAPQVVKFCAEEGLILRAVYETVALCPPLIVTEEDIDKILARLGKALDRGWEWVQAEGLV